MQDKLKEELDKIIGENAHGIYDIHYDYELYSERWVYKSCVIPFIHNMRDVIRLSNEFGLRYRLLRDDVEAGDLLGITTLEIFRPDLHRWIMENKHLLCSPSGDEIAQPQNHVEARTEELKAQLDNFLSESKETAELEEKDREAVESLFPIARYAEADKSPDNDLAYKGGYRNIYHPDHFDAYFRLSIEQGILHEYEYKRFLLDDPLDRNDLDDEHWKTLTDNNFSSKAGRYFKRYGAGRTAKIVDFCLDLESKAGPDYYCPYPSLAVAVSIMNAADDSQQPGGCMDEVLQAIIESKTAVSKAVAAYLAADLHSAIFEFNDEVDLPRITRINRLMIGNPHLHLTHQTDEKLQLEKKWLRQLCDYLKSSPSKKQGHPPNPGITRIYANAIPSLFGTDDSVSNDDEYEAFKVFMQVIPESQSPIYIAEALTGKVEHWYYPKDVAETLTKKVEYSYVMDLPLLRRLITPESYKLALKEWRNNMFPGFVDWEIYCILAYATTVSNPNASDTVSEQAVKDVWDKMNTHK